MATGHGSMTHDQVNEVCKRLERNPSLDKTSKIIRAGGKAAAKGHTTASHMPPGSGGGGGHTHVKGHK